MGRPIRLLLNDRLVELDVAAGMAALDVVRENLGLKGTKHACSASSRRRAAFATGR